MEDKKQPKSTLFQNKHLAIFILTVIILGIVWLIDFVDSHLANVFTHAELYCQDRQIELRAKVRKNTQASSDIVVVLINDATIKKFGLPPSRESEANLLRALSHYHPKAIVFDLTFERERDEVFDSVLAELSQKYGNAVYPMTMEPKLYTTTDDSQSSSGSLAHIFQRFAFPSSSIDDLTERKQRKHIPSRLPYAALLKTAMYLGHIKAITDPDGKVRRIPMYYDYPSLSLAAVCAFKGIPIKRIIRQGKSLVLDDGKGWRRKIPIDSEGYVRVNYFGDERSFNRHAFHIICDEWTKDKTTLPLREYFEDKLVFIGSASRSFDLTATPFSRQLPGVFVHATFADNILKGEFIPNASQPLNIFVLIGFTGLMVASQLLPSLSQKRRWTDYILRFVYGFGIIIAFGTFTFFAFYFKGMFLNFSLPLFALGIGYVIATGYRYVEELQKQRRILIETYSEIRKNEINFIENEDVDFNQIANRLTEYHCELQKQHEARLNLIANAPHDLKGPLNALKSQVKLCLDKLRKNEKLEKPCLKDALFTINVHAEKAMSRIDDLLDASKIEAERFELRKEKIQLNFIVDRYVRTFKPDAERKKITIIKQLSNVSMLKADPKAIERVIENLLLNAIHFTPEDGTITIGTQNQQDFAEIYVDDTGPGISPDIKERIFDLYFSGRKSTGVGLFLAKGIVELHGGQIKAENKPAGGSIFTFTVPKSEDGGKQHEQD